MKLSEFENEAALDLLADIIEPAAKIFSDPGVKKIYEGGSKMDLIQYIIKNHKQPIIAILAALDGVPAKDYKANIIKMTKDLLNVFNDPDLQDFFTSAAQRTE